MEAGEFSGKVSFNSTATREEERVPIEKVEKGEAQE